MLFMYSVSFSVLGKQYIFGDIIGIEMTNFEGTPITSNLLAMIDVDALNISKSNVVNTNETTVKTDPVIAAADIAWEIFLLLTGTYIFNVMILFGVPVIFVSGLIFLYLIMLARAFIAYLRGI